MKSNENQILLFQFLQGFGVGQIWHGSGGACYKYITAPAPEIIKRLFLWFKKNGSGPKDILKTAPADS